MPPRKFSVLEAIEKLESRTPRVCAQTPPLPGWPRRVAERWRTLMEFMAGCRSANEVNGHIIHVRQHQIRQLIDIVRGGAVDSPTARKVRPSPSRCARWRGPDPC